MSTTLEVSLCWCNTCSKLVTLETRRPQNSSSSSSSSSSCSRSCPNCVNNGGSVDKITREQLLPSLLSVLEIDENDIPNPHIYIHRPTSSSNQNTRGGFDCYYDDGSGSGFTLSPSAVLSSDDYDYFHDVLDTLRREGIGERAIALLSTVEIQESHVSSNQDCTVCLEPFDLGTKAKEMPVCKHLYHSDCILPWLALDDSCPLCRRQLTTDEEEEEVVALVVWRCSYYLYVVGQFSGGSERLVQKLRFGEEEDEEEDDPTTLERITHFLKNLLYCFYCFTSIM